MKLLSTNILFFLIIAMSLSAQNVQIKKLAISSQYSSEISPFIKDSVLYYSSNRPVSFFKRYYDENRQLLYHIFSAHLNTDSTFSKPQRFEKDLLSPFNTGSITFSTNGDQMFIAQNHYDTYKRSNKSKSGNLMGIYLSETSNRGWGRKISLPFNSRRNYNTAQPSISPDGHFLFFISDMENGFGKTDIYFSENINGEWGPATNLGDMVNTSGSELFPYYHPSGRLYFASNGHNTKGGIDLFYTTLADDGWTSPQPLNEINTDANEFSCYISDDGQWGIFSSDREGVDNLYRFDLSYPDFESCEIQKEDNYCYEFFDDVTLESGEQHGPYRYQWTFNNVDKAIGDTVIHCFSAPGEYNVRLSMIDTSIDEEVFALSEYNMEVNRIEQIYISVQDTIKTNQVTTFDVSDSNLGDFSPKEFYWDMGDGTLLKGETIQHIFRTKGQYLVQCGAISTKHPQLKMCSVKQIIVSD
nr:PKD domain-containing protein [uncultured Carboxylicivirga sp.]